MTRTAPLAIAALIASLSGCFAATADEAAEDSFQDDDIPMGGCNTGTGGCGSGTADASGAPPGASCDNTGQCANEGVCVAPFEDSEPGALVCRIGCVQTGDPRAWCSDDDACCSGFCGARGECLAEAPGVDDTGGDTDSTPGSTDTGPTSGGADESDTGATSESTDGTTDGTTGGSSTGDASSSGGGSSSSTG